MLYMALGLAAIAVAAVIRRSEFPLLYLAVAIALLLAYLQPAKAIPYAVIFLATASGMIRSEKSVFLALYGLLIASCIAVVLQLSGVSDAAYGWVSYGNEAAAPTSLLEGPSVPAEFLPQIRPSGIFPAPTYLTYLCITLYAAIFLAPAARSTGFPLTTGVLFALTGSTAGLLLAALSVLTAGWSRVGFCVAAGYVGGLSLYAEVFPDLFAYNYNVLDLQNSLLDRVMDESILTQNPGVFFAMTLLIGLPALYVLSRTTYRTSGRLVLPAVVLIFFPLVLHDVSASVLYACMMGLGVGMVYSAYLSQYAPPRRLGPRRLCAGPSRSTSDVRPKAKCSNPDQESSR